MLLLPKSLKSIEELQNICIYMTLKSRKRRKREGSNKISTLIELLEEKENQTLPETTILHDFNVADSDIL